MAWLWKSWEEYVKNVHPVTLDSPGRATASQRDSWFVTERYLSDAANRLEESTSMLQKLGFTGNDGARYPTDAAVLSEAKPLVLEAIYAGEELLLYHKRLAESDAAYGFLHQNDMLPHWNRYAESGRILKEIHQLVKDIKKLLNTYHELVQADERFIVSGLNLPVSLEGDFRLARDLFSVGFDEVALLMAGRGLEGVLRDIAKRRRISLETKKGKLMASEADLYDLIEALYRVHWKANGTPFITKETKALLHYLRELRNSGAHPGHRKFSIANAREVAIVAVETAKRLWSEASTTRARLRSLVVQKTW